MNVKAAVQFSIGPLLSAAFGFITIPVVAWGFDSQDVGRLTMLQVVMSLGVMVFSLAMHQAYVREYYEVEDKALLLRTALTPGLAFLVCTIIGVSLLPISLSGVLFDINSSLVTTLFFAGIAFNFVINMLIHVVRMEQRGLAFSISQALPRVLLLLFILSILFTGSARNFTNLLTANTTAFLVTLCVSIALTSHNWRFSATGPVDSALLKRMIKFSYPLVFGSIAYWGLTAMDRLFIKALVGLESLGVYAVAVTMASAVTVLSMIFSNLWHPIVYKWAKTEVDHNRIEAVAESIFLLVATVWSLAGLVSWILPFFFPPEYQSIRFLVVACVAMPLFYMLSEATVVGIGISRKSGYAMASSTIAFAVNAGLNYIFIPTFGISGAAIASMIAFFVFFLVRTEASCYVWKPISRSKIYALSLAYSATTIWFVGTHGETGLFVPVWLGLMALTYIAFSKRIRLLVKSPRRIGSS